jgi:beta-galactosidase
MKIRNNFRFIGSVLVAILLFSSFTTKNVAITKRDRLFNSGWKFIRDSVKMAEKPGYDDSNWMVVDLPHDFSMMNLPGADNPDQKIGPFSKKSPGGISSGRVMGGTGWYRKQFIVNKIDVGKTFVLKFDGVYMTTDVWVNGKQVGVHKYGYTPFWFDITSLLNPAGQSNVIAVKVENVGQNTRWYSGSGIYRNVHLVVTNPIHVGVWGVKIVTPEVKPNDAKVDVAVSIQNDGNISKDAVVKVEILNAGNKVVREAEITKRVEAGKNTIVNKQVVIANPALWSLETPNIYQAKITVLVDNKVVDQYKQPFGIRSIEYSAEKGFLLNGKSVELKGGCIHHDNGLLGSAAIDRAEERKVEILKANGFNAIRTSHNPPSETFLNACDRLGMLVLDEFTDMWEKPKKPQDYSMFFREYWKKDLVDMVQRDRNHPSVIMWSIGNEIPERMDSSGLRIAKQLVGAFRELDSTRPITEAVNGEYAPVKPWEATAPMFALLDICGYNYEWKRVETDHQKYPDRVMFGSESFAAEASDYWETVKKHSYVIGDFVWTAMDYLGESGIGRAQCFPTEKSYIKSELGINLKAAMLSFSSKWPWFGANCGDIDVCGEKKPQKAYRDIVWDNSKLEINVHSFVPTGQTEVISPWGWPDEWQSWSWKGIEGKPLQVRVFTKASHVKLELNGKTIGEKDLKVEDKYIAVFQVPYQAGELKATSFENGKEVATKVLKTAGEPASIRLTADRNKIKADPNDLSFVRIEVIDANGQLVQSDLMKIKLTVSGNGELVASGNANPCDMESVNQTVINTYKGKAQAIIRPKGVSGKIVLKVKIDGLVERSIQIFVN